MPAPLVRIETSDALPSEADVVVIGGGIIGACTTYYLAKRGVKVVLLEKGLIGAEQSSRNWGWCRQQNRDARELPLATRSLALWDALPGEIGEDVGFRRCGLTYLTDDAEQLATWTAWCDFARGEGVETHVMTAEMLARRGSVTGKTWLGGVWSPSDGTADPSRAAPMFAKGVEKFGGTVVQTCAARGIERHAGRVGAVITEKGEIRTAQVVMAGGAWASSFCRQHGVRFPQATIRSTVVSVAGAQDIPDAVFTPDSAITRRADGTVTLAIGGRGELDPTLQTLRFAGPFMPMWLKRRKSVLPGTLQGMCWGHETLVRWVMDQPTPMEKARILDPKPSNRVMNETLERARKVMPGLRDATIRQSWAGYIDSTPDGIPVIGQVPGLPGCILAAGFSGHGFGIGPGTGYMIADMVTGTPSYVDTNQYRLSRFDKGAWGKVAEF
ncbi:NAD(P)/FAD-dependent oxidoreductase [Thalassobaculum sp.]|uniref:NAD(P)/FAD-dependent oxidoreductase n=1 Tax=Thalassobaculum sp. TaxID=2022740 RepID=UPI003B5B0B5A